MAAYLVKAAGAWFAGFFPLAEIYVAVPAAVAVGLDDLSVIFWTVSGNFTPALLIHFLYEWLSRSARVRAWLEWLSSEKARERINRYGLGFVLLFTPWTGIWIMAVAARALGMDAKRFLAASLTSILAYAIVLLLLIRLGLAAAG